MAGSRKQDNIDVASGIALPIDFVTARVALLGMSGAGKSNGFAVMVESVYDVGAAFTFLDPLGAAYGLRSSADGNGPGLNVPIFGGYHGDLKLRPDSGALIARELYKLDASAVLDLSAFNPDEQCIFVADYCDELLALHLRRKKVRALFVDEAGRLASQRPASSADVRSATSLWRLHTGGRGIGIGLKTATQSSADQDKRTIKQAEMIVALRVFSPLDQKPILDYLNTTVEKARATEIKSSLAKLKNGEAWFIAPQWLGEVVKARFHLRRTFDSSATPKLGQQAKEPRILASVDLDRIRRAIEKSSDSLQSDDPAALHAEIARLQSVIREHDLGSASSQEIAAPQTVEVRVEVPILSEEAIGALTTATEAVSAATDTAARAAAVLAESLSSLKASANEIATSVASARSLADAPPPLPTRPPIAFAKTTGKRPFALSTSSGESDLLLRGRRRSAKTPTPAQPNATEPKSDLRAGAIRMLQELARSGGTLTKAQLSTLAEVKKGGTFSQYLRSLVNSLYVEDGGSSVHLLAAGAKAVGENIRTEPQSTQEIVARYAPKLRAGANRMLDILIRAYPREVENETLSREAEVKPGGTLSQYRRMLISNGLATEHGRRMRASDTLFMKPR